jgi:CheY-like chemotaxis protein
MENTTTCLFIDDDPDDQFIFVETIKKISSSITCLLSFNGMEAIAKLLSAQFKPEVIFLDLKMPLMNGLNFLKEKMKHDVMKHIPVYVLSDYVIWERERASQFGVWGFIRKPYSLFEWEEALKKVFQFGLKDKAEI